MYTDDCNVHSERIHVCALIHWRLGRARMGNVYRLLFYSGNFRHNVEPGRSFDCMAFALCLWGIVYENTAGTCEWYLPAGVKVRKPASVRMNQMARNAPFFDEETRDQKTRLFGGEIGGRLMWFWNPYRR